MGTAYADVCGSDTAVQIQILSWVLARLALDGRENQDLISASFLAGIDFNKKVLEQFRLGMSHWTDSDSEKEN